MSDLFAGLPPIDRTWRPSVSAVSGRIVVEAECGALMMGGAFYKSTRSERRARRLVIACQRWCDKRNAKEAAAEARADAILARLEDSGVATR